MEYNRLLLDHTVLRLVQIALAEDIGVGDITTEALVMEDALAQATFIAKSPGVVAGLEIASLAMTEVDPALGCEWSVEEGARVEKGSIIGEVRGPAASILTAERTALNFLQRMSGVATLTRRYVDAIEGTGATMLDTRKTIPGWRILDKYAVAVGGGSNHRMGLWDMVMIKDNHIAAHGSITGAVEAVRRYLAGRGAAAIPIEVETTNLEQVREALSVEGVTRIMFDNASLEMMREGVAIVAGRCETEASGNVSLETVRAIAETGVQFISCGALTHSVPALDISLEVKAL
jgi:nicotinate-nucleotide pyrophosphorylase (carboxylating)